MTTDPPSGSSLSRRSLLRGAAVVAGAGATVPLIRPRPALAARRSRRTTPTTPDYLGYRRADYDKPWAKYFSETCRPVQAQIRKAVAGPPTAATDIPARGELPVEINTRGYSKVETGYGSLADGTIWTAALTRMPGVTPAMWDWWFGWHSAEPSRYKLWQPEAHLYAALRKPLADEPGLTDKERYIGNTSYVDEYLPDYRGGRHYLGDHAGAIIASPGISFVDPASVGIDLSTFDGTAIVGRGGNGEATGTVTTFVHQVRRVRGGSEMRSRFYINGDPASNVRPARPNSAAEVTARTPLPPGGAPPAQLSVLHTGMEMNHLAGFLPRLHAEFRHDKPRRGSRRS